MKRFCFLLYRQKGGDNMNAAILEKYVDKVYSYAIKRTYTDDEAAELTQEIFLSALKSLPKLRNDEKFEPWLWGVAENISKSFSRKKGKERAIFSYDIPDIPDDKPDEDFSEEYGILREKIAYLSKIYRDVTILYYYDGLSIKEIAERLHIPDGTVTWRLSEARRKIEKEITDMEQSALTPKKLSLSIYGSGNYDGISRPFPTAYINDALSQNILLYCYDDPRTIEQMSKYLGVPAFYIEDRVENLVRRDAMKEEPKGKYITYLFIYEEKYNDYWSENAEKTMLPVADEFVAALKNIAEEAYALDHYKGTKSKDDLFYLYSVMALLDVLQKKYSKREYPKIERKYDGFFWVYDGDTTGFNRNHGIAVNLSANNYQHRTFTHTVYSGFAGIKHKKMMYDYEINACVDIMKNGATDNKEAATSAIKSGYILKDDSGAFIITSPVFTIAQKEKFCRIVEKYFSPIAEKFIYLAEQFITGYKRIFPNRFSKEAERRSYNSYSGLGTILIKRMIERGEIAPPSNGYVCDVLCEQ